MGNGRTGSSTSPEIDARAQQRAAVLEDGILSGMIGAAVVALWFLLLDIARAQPFYTPTLLGSVLFLGSSVEEVTAADPGMVFAYTGVHILAFLAAGCALAWMFSQFERNPQFGIVLLLLFALFEAVLFGFEVSVVPTLVGALGAWAVALANLLSAVAMFWFLLIRHPKSIARLREGWQD